MEKTMTLNLRVNPTVKQQAEDVLKQPGHPDGNSYWYVPAPNHADWRHSVLAVPAEGSCGSECWHHDRWPTPCSLQVGIKEIQNGDTVDAASAFAQFREQHRWSSMTWISHAALSDMEQIYSYIADRLLEPDTAKERKRVTALLKPSPVTERFTVFRALKKASLSKGCCIRGG